MKSIAHIASFVFHPLFILTYGLILLMLINPYIFLLQDPRDKGLIIISTFLLSAFFPLVAILMMKALGLISSLKMEDRMERIGPLVATSIFYLWLYLNIKDNPGIPGAFSFFVLGSTIALFFSFFLNIFQKISLHAVGMGGLVVGLILMGTHFSYGSFVFQVAGFGIFKVGLLLLYIVLVMVAGITLSSRLILRAHSRDEVYGGFFVGCISQLLGFLLFF